MATASDTLEAGAAESVITPPPGVTLSGWAQRAAGHNRATYIHDDLYARALVVRRGARAWALIATDLPGVDPVATEQIRARVASATPLRPEAALVCATHCHCAPVTCPHALACAAEEFSTRSVQSNGRIPMGFGGGRILGLPDEPFTAVGRAIREQSGAHPLLIAALANDYGAAGYIAEAASWDLGGYEVEFFPLARDAAGTLVAAAVSLLNEAGETT